MKVTEDGLVETNYDEGALRAPARQPLPSAAPLPAAPLARCHRPRLISLLACLSQ